MIFRIFSSGGSGGEVIEKKRLFAISQSAEGTNRQRRGLRLHLWRGGEECRSAFRMSLVELGSAFAYLAPVLLPFSAVSLASHPPMVWEEASDDSTSD